MPGGRPAKYSVAYCGEVISAGQEGLSLTAFAGMIGVCRDTISEWVKVHPEFSASVKIHQAKRTEYLERTLLSSDVGPRVTARIFALKNACPEEWKDKVETEQSGTITNVHKIERTYHRPQD